VAFCPVALCPWPFVRVAFCPDPPELRHHTDGRPTMVVKIQNPIASSCATDFLKNVGKFAIK